MATHVSTRTRAPPQLPPIRQFALYPSHVASKALTAIDTTTITSSRAGTTASIAKLSLSRPLPTPPTAPSVHRSLPPPAVPIRQQFSSTSTSSDRSSTNPNDLKSSRSQPPLSNFFSQRSNSTPLMFALQVPNVLHAILCQLEWSDAYPLFTTCKGLSAFFQNPELRDVILSRFVPGYAQSLRNRDMKFYQDIPVTVFDLDLLLISQRVPLHRYPLHSLKIQSSILPSVEDDRITEKLSALTQAHSRFILLLQSLVHSSSARLPQEAEEGISRPRFSPIQTLRELTFPAPLAYSEPSAPPVPPPPPPKGISSGKSLKKHARHKSAPTTSVRSTGYHEYSAPPWPTKPQLSPRPSADAASSMISNGHLVTLKKGRRLSIFGKKNSMHLPKAPPPPDEPRALRVYASTWRKTASWGSYGDIPIDLGKRSSGTFNRRPKRVQSRLGSIHDSTSDSSLSGPSPLSQSRSRNSMFVPPEARAASPHDLILATSRSRAPVLRVFVPCSKLETDSESLVKCEQHLVESGLWDHLSTGDIVCNLGFVPPVEEGSNSSDSDDPNASSGGGEFIMMRPSASSGLANSVNGGGATNNSSSSQKWLLFNGHVLVPYTPPDLLPLDQPLNLPTPFYYAHIMPPFTNLSYVITQLPVCDDVPQMTLVYSSKKVPSPHSPNGFAMVKKYSWIARVVRLRTEADGEMGEGWFGEWILEGEGTPEGKMLLVNALKGYNLGHREWELVREKSGGGKLWLRLLTIC